MPPTPRNFRIRHELAPGDLGMVVHLHGVLYAREHGLDTTFEPYVAKPLADFVLSGSGRLWIAEEGDRMVGSIALVDADPGIGQLRWFLVVPEARGTGLGKRLLDEALAYARQRGLHAHLSLELRDLDGRAAALRARGLQDHARRRTSFVWGAERTEVRMDLELSDVRPFTVKLRPARSAPS